MAGIGSCSVQDFENAVSIFGSSDAATSMCTSYDVASMTVTGAALAYTIQQLRVTTSQLENTASLLSTAVLETKYGLNTALVLLGAFNIFVMQIGFATFVAGAIRAKNLASILLKSVIDTCISVLSYYVVGYAFTAGDADPNNGFIGNKYFALANLSDKPHGYDSFMWNWVFCAVSTTIMAGSVAERCTFVSYLLYAAFYACWVYPVYAHWNWDYHGWLSPSNPNAILGMGTVDFAGSGVVHTLGGFAALMGSIVLGPRIGRWDAENRHMYQAGQNPALYLLGTFLLWFGWYSFNSISLLHIDTVLAANTIARTAITTTLSASAAGCVTVGLSYWKTRTWNMLEVCNGILGGLVGITSGCAVVEPWAAIICGIVAAPCVVYGEHLLEWLKIDDPAGAFSIHGLSGIWGMLFVGLLAKEQYLVEVYHKEAGHHYMGIFYGGHGQLLVCQFIAVVVNIAWVCFWMYPFFTSLSYLGILRVGLEEEAMGLDARQMGNINQEHLIITSSKTPEPSIHIMTSQRSPLNTYFGQRESLSVRSMGAASVYAHGDKMHRIKFNSSSNIPMTRQVSAGDAAVGLEAAAPAEPVKTLTQRA